MVVRGTQLGTAGAGQLSDLANRRLPDPAGACQRWRHSRIYQQLPPSRRANLSGAAWGRLEARMSLSSVDLRSRRLPVRGSPDGVGIRSKSVGPAAGAL